MIRIEVKSNAVQVKEGVSERTGKDYRIREQEAWAHLYSPGGSLQPYPTRMVINLEEKQSPYEPGDYTIEPSCFHVERYGALRIGRIALKKLTANVKAAA